MKLHSLKIKGFRRHYDSEILFSDATFLIGSNNVGKSAVFKGLEYLLNDKKKMEESDFMQILNESNENEILSTKVELTGVFRNVPTDAWKWLGFNKQRLFKYENKDSNESGLQIIYRKTYENGQCKIEMKQLKMTLKSQFQDCKNINDLLAGGLSEEIVDILFEGKSRSTKLTEKLLSEVQDLGIEEVDEIFDSNPEEIWFLNPGGIAGNVISRLPKFLLIPDIAETAELAGKKGALIETLNSLFEDVRNASENFKQAQHYLNLLAKELDPKKEGTDFHELMSDLNKVVGEVFPETTFFAEANLSDANQVISPSFDITLGSNITTDVQNQGTGVIRSAIFALLRYRSIRENKKKKQTNEYIRPLVIGFEEPEIYLHPKAAQQMRETIYELACENHNQIIATTHSPYMIDLSKNSSQILNLLKIDQKQVLVNGKDKIIEIVSINPFNVTEAFRNLQEDERMFLKMIIKIDDNIAKVFFTQNVLIVEGDTEEVVLKESIARMPKNISKNIQNNWEIVKARGKATIISLVKYLKAMGIDPYVIHDMDSEKPNAMKFNDPILTAVGDSQRRILLENCIEDVLGYAPPSKEKPYKAYSFIAENWSNEWDSISPQWKSILESIFKGEYKTSVQLEEVAAGLESIE